MRQLQETYFINWDELIVFSFAATLQFKWVTMRQGKFSTAGTLAVMACGGRVVLVGATLLPVWHGEDGDIEVNLQVKCDGMSAPSF